jgi:myo-inositol-1(or 4)-monophosphatase
MNEILSTAIAAARAGGAILREHLGKVRSIELKDGEEKNLVTEIDRQSEETIIGIIHSAYPGHAILAEESGGAGSSEYRWVIDPLDGTVNYTHGFPVFSVSIGVERNGELIAGVVYDPNFDEMFTAELGKGAYVNGARIQVSAAHELKRSMLVTGFPYNIAENPNHAIEHFVNYLLHSQAVRRMGSAAIDLAYVAAGRYDGFWEVALNPWDMAAGILLVREAGGTVTGFHGEPFTLNDKAILATNGLIHDQMKAVLASPVLPPILSRSASGPKR